MKKQKKSKIILIVMVAIVMIGLIIGVIFKETAWNNSLEMMALLEQKWSKTLDAQKNNSMPAESVLNSQSVTEQWNTIHNDLIKWEEILTDSVLTNKLQLKNEAKYYASFNNKKITLLKFVPNKNYTINFNVKFKSYNHYQFRHKMSLIISNGILQIKESLTTYASKKFNYYFNDRLQTYSNVLSQIQTNWNTTLKTILANNEWTNVKTSDIIIKPQNSNLYHKISGKQFNVNSNITACPNLIYDYQIKIHFNYGTNPLKQLTSKTWTSLWTPFKIYYYPNLDPNLNKPLFSIDAPTNQQLVANENKTKTLIWNNNIIYNTHYSGAGIHPFGDVWIHPLFSGSNQKDIRILKDVFFIGISSHYLFFAKNKNDVSQSSAKGSEVYYVDLNQFMRTLGSLDNDAVSLNYKFLYDAISNVFSGGFCTSGDYIFKYTDLQNNYGTWYYQNIKDLGTSNWTKILTSEQSATTKYSNQVNNGYGFINYFVTQSNGDLICFENWKSESNYLVISNLKPGNGLKIQQLFKENRKGKLGASLDYGLFSTYEQTWVIGLANSNSTYFQIDTLSDLITTGKWNAKYILDRTDIIGISGDDALIELERSKSKILISYSATIGSQDKTLPIWTFDLIDIKPTTGENVKHIGLNEVLSTSKSNIKGLTYTPTCYTLNYENRYLIFSGAYNFDHENKIDYYAYKVL